MLESRPLAGLRVLVTRAEARAGSLCRGLAAEGADVLLLPCLHIEPPEDPRALGEAIAGVGGYDGVLLTSASGAEAFGGALAAAGASRAPLGGVQLLCVGPATAAALAEQGLAASFTLPGGKGGGAALADALAGALGNGRPGKGRGGSRILWVRGDRALGETAERLRARGARVDEVVAYRTALPTAADAPRWAGILRRIEAGEIDAAIFASPSAVEGLGVLLGGEAERDRALSRSALVAIGETTASALRRRGLRVGAVAGAATVPALVEAIRAIKTCRSIGRSPRE